MAPRKAATAKEAVEKKETVVKKEAAPVKKTAEKKAPARKTAVKEQVVLQFAGREMNTADIMKKVKTHWTKVLKNKAGDIKSVTLYVKPEESMVYYVINDDVTGSVEL